MPRLEGGTNQTSKIALIVVAVLIAAGVAWYAISAGQNGAATDGATPTASGSPQAGSPPPPPDATTTALPEVTSALNSEMGADTTPAPNAMDGGAMSSATPMAGADAMSAPTANADANADGATVTTTPAGSADSMPGLSDAPAPAPAAP